MLLNVTYSDIVGKVIIKQYEEVITMSYEEILKCLKTAKPGKECRALHKELKKFGDGLAFMYRYPKSTIILSIISAIIGTLALCISAVRLFL